MMSCMDNILKNLIFLCHFLLICTGCGLIGLGIFVHFNYGLYYNIFGDNVFSSNLIILATAGGVLIFLASFGCCGACMENSCLMYASGWIMSFVVVAEIGLALAFAILKAQMVEVLGQSLLSSYPKLDDPDRKGVMDAWDEVQKNLKCCGVNNNEDWGQTPSFNATSSVPDSCCVDFTTHCGNGQLTSPDKIYVDGCLKAIEEIIKQNFAIVIGIASTIMLIQIIGICCACRVAKNMRETKDY